MESTAATSKSKENTPLLAFFLDGLLLGGSFTFSGGLLWEFTRAGRLVQFSYVTNNETTYSCSRSSFLSLRCFGGSLSGSLRRIEERVLESRPNQNDRKGNAKKAHRGHFNSGLLRERRCAMRLHLRPSEGQRELTAGLATSGVVSTGAGASTLVSSTGAATVASVADITTSE